jgi:hypothetical protein
MNASIKLEIESSNLTETLDQFLELLKHSPNVCHERIQRFFRFRNAVAKLTRINSKGFGASGTGEFGIGLEPSQLLLNVIAAMRASNV